MKSFFRLPGLALCLFPILAFSQHETTSVFSVVENDTTLSSLISEKLILAPDLQAISNIHAQQPEQLSLSVPLPDGRTLDLEMQRVKILADSFKTNSNNGPVDYQPGAYYRGTIAGNDHSLAAFSFFDNSLMGVFSDSTGNYVIGETSGGKYVCYNDKKLLVTNPFHCETADDSPGSSERSVNSGNPSVQSGNCIRMYFECDYAMYQANGSNTTTELNFVTGMFNVVATLYSNESVTLTLSEVFIWTSQDPFLSFNSNIALGTFDNYRAFFNADAGMLLAEAGSNNGGLAHMNALCSQQRTSYSNIYNSYAALPTYSWTVNVVAHELGHNLGSHHTHWCGWVGGPIDTCNVCFNLPTEGSCANGPRPTNGGTVMSYCHGCGSIGINFSNGFGPQPGNAIRNFISSSPCVSCTTCTPAATPVPTYGNATGPGPSNASPVLTWTGSAQDYFVQLKCYPYGANDDMNTPTNCVTGNTYSASSLPSCMVYQYNVTGHTGNCNTWCLGSTSADSYFCIPPVLPATSTICPGDSAYLAISNPVVQFGNCFFNYQWYFNSSPISGATGFSHWTSTPGNYYLQVVLTDPYNHLLPDTIFSNVCAVVADSAPAPVIISGPDTTCANYTGVLTIANPCSGCSYHWSNGQNGTTCYVLNTGTYSVNVFNSCGFSSGSHYIVFLGMPDNPNVVGPHVICPGDTAHLTISNLCSYCTYTWNTGATTPYLNVTTPGSYWATANNGCSMNSMNPFSVTISSLPTANAGSDVTIVAGDTTQLNGSGGVSCSWSPGAWLSDSTTCSPLANPPVNTTYTLTVTNANGCSNTDQVNVMLTTCANTISPLAQSFGYFGGLDSFMVTPNSNNCHWTAATTDPWIHVIDTAGTGTGMVHYTVDSCSASTNQTGMITVGSQTYTVNQSCITTGIENAAAQTIALFPNPATESVFINANGFNGNCELLMYDALGQVVLKKEISGVRNSFRYELSLNGVAPGVYWIVVKDETGNKMMRLVKE